MSNEETPMPGDEVQISIIWASQGPNKPVLKSWAPGYVFVRQEADNGVVRHVTGLYIGIEVRYPMYDIRVGGVPYEADLRS